MVDSKFNSVFYPKNNKKLKTPTALKRKLNSQAPKGYSYELMAGTDDMYCLRSKKNLKENSFQVRIKFPVEFEGMKIRNIDELQEAIYRTQKPFKLDQTLQNNPPTIIHLRGSGVTQQFIGPVEKFPDLEPLKIKIGNHELFVPIKRIPYASLTEIKIVSDSNHLIKLELIVHEDTSEIKIIAGLNYNCLTTLNDFFENEDIICSFFSEGMTIYNKNMKPDKQQIESFKYNHSFFTALKYIQKELDISFNFPQKIDNDDVFFTKLLFESFVNKRVVALKHKKQISLLFDKGKYDGSKHELNEDEKIGVIRPVELSLELFGAKVDLLEYNIYPQMTFKRIIEKNSEEMEMVFDLPDNNNHFILLTLDSIDDFDMTSDGQELFKLVDNAIPIGSIDFSLVF
ncbi:abortive infection system toxin AbiGii family protein [Streptococcus equinus]|uniref:abortive infection system toxin AbiGii family protein n=1 Tax=Streptococcus equinus TaxID=1335 RepID=UPI00215B3A41|nr:abortive infection system toxin AbiGii family protein [Streptococcus equinus]UVF03559.1 hypothetical protein KRG72_04515 [Streptococcus equinus]